MLFTTIPAHGHFAPLLPLARAMQAADHTVAVATAKSFRPVVERAGLELLPVGIDGVAARSRALAADPDDFFIEFFIGQFATALVGDFDTFSAWAPDVVVREEGEYAGPPLAALAGVPWVDHGWGPIRPLSLVEQTAEALEPLWNGHGLAADERGGAFRWLYVDPCPPSLQFAHASDVSSLHQIRPLTSSKSQTEDVPAWLDMLDGRCAVYVTLGTVPRFANDVAFFVAAIDALQESGLHVVVTVGPEGDAAALGEHLRSNVHVERFVAQAALLPHCVAAITNGGSGSTLGALAAGVPVLAATNAASPSQVRNGEAVVQSGAGRSLTREEVSPERLKHEVAMLLTDGAYREVASEIAAEIAAMPEPAHVVSIVEQVVERHQPYTRST